MAGGIIGGVGAGMGTDVLLTKVPEIVDTMKKGVDATMTYVSGTASTVKQTASRAYDATADAAQSARQYTCIS